MKKTSQLSPKTSSNETQFINMAESNTESVVVEGTNTFELEKFGICLTYLFNTIERKCC
jgi:hypothetical protein